MVLCSTTSSMAVISQSLVWLPVRPIFESVIRGSVSLVLSILLLLLLLLLVFSLFLFLAT